MKTKASYLLITSLILSTSTVYAQKSLSDGIPEFRPGILMGYTDLKKPIASDKILPPSPEKDMAVMQADIARAQQAYQLKGTARWDLAKHDAELMFPNAAKAFSCALNTDISEKNTPYLYLLLRRTLADIGLSTYPAKNLYQRQRPFAYLNQESCTPQEEAKLRVDGSYPSGHSAIGWGWALLLSELAPERETQIMQRGLAFSNSRVYCNVHWQSDVQAGRDIAAIAVAKLHNNKDFLHDFNKARDEIAKAVNQGVSNPQHCEWEAKAMALESQK